MQDDRVKRTREEESMAEPDVEGSKPLGLDATLAAMYGQHRADFFVALGSDAALLFGSTVKSRNGDVDYTYRPGSDILYLSGWTDPECALLFRPGADHPFVMFVRPNNPSREVWTGRRPGLDGAQDVYGADIAYSIDELATMLPDLLQGYSTLHYRVADDFGNDRLVVGAIAAARRKARMNNLDVPSAFIDPGRVLHELRLIKSGVEIDLLQKAADITQEAHLEAMRTTRPGGWEYELEAVIAYVFRRHGAHGPGYPSIVGGGVNATILHYSTNHQMLNDGDLVCVDAGCEFQWYTADVTRTWPVNGRFSPAQNDLYNVVLDAEIAAIAKVEKGRPWSDIHATSTRVLTKGMVRLGLLGGDWQDETHIDKLIASGEQKRYFMHGTSHWLGMDVHDVGAYSKDGESRKLEPGMVMTVEPGIYVPADDTAAPEIYRGIGIRIEDDVLVGEKGPIVLTAGIPKTVEAIEAWMAQ